MKVFYFLMVIFCSLLCSSSMAQQVLLYPNNGYVYSYPYVVNYNYPYPVYSYQAVNSPFVVQQRGCWPFHNKQYYQVAPSQYYMNYSHYYYYPAVVPYQSSYEYVPWGAYRY